MLATASDVACLQTYQEHDDGETPPQGCPADPATGRGACVTR